MDDRSDEELIEAVGAGDRRAFRALYRRYRGAIYAFLRRRTGDSAVAEDLCQEVFMAVLDVSKRWEPRAKVSTLIYRIAANQLGKSRRRAPQSSFDEDQDHTAQTRGPEQEASSTEQARLVRGALARLDDDQRVVLVLHQYHGLSYAEVAEVLEIPVGTVRSRISRAKAALRKDLAEVLRREEGGA
jgi:RNA polymerase sigma-70 factor (ECF subfamily)